MSEVRTAIPSAVSSSAARPPERTAAAAPHSSAHRRVLDLQGGGRRAMMLVGLAQHNQPQRQSEPGLVPLLPHSPKTSSSTCKKHSLPVCCLSLPATTLSRRRPSTTTITSNHPRQAHRFRPLVLSAPNNDGPAFPNESHARDNNLRLDSWTRIQPHTLARTVYLVKRRYTTCLSRNPTSIPPK